jgi:hypothetical protein
MITRVSGVIQPEGFGDLIFDHPYNADCERCGNRVGGAHVCATIVSFCARGSLGKTTLIAA